MTRKKSCNLPIERTTTANNILLLLLSQDSGSDCMSCFKAGSIASLSSDTRSSGSFFEVPLLAPSSRNLIKLGWNAPESFGLTNQCNVYKGKTSFSKNLNQTMLLDNIFLWKAICIRPPQPKY